MNFDILPSGTEVAQALWPAFAALAPQWKHRIASESADAHVNWQTEPLKWDRVYRLILITIRSPEEHCR